MSKSPSIFIPAIGGTALVLGLAYGLSSRNYGADTIEVLETRVQQAEKSATVARENASAVADRATQLELQIAEVQAAAIERAAASTNLTEPAQLSDVGYNIGRPALDEEIAAWDIDVLPDGRGLPTGSGDVLTGEEVFVDRCAACHGDFAEGVDNWPVLAGGFDTLGDEDPVKTVGSYWPYLSTSWDYINRSMPFGEAGTLTADETYAIVAYLMYSNDMVDDDFVLSQENFADVEMHNADGFVLDDRPEQEYAAWRAEPCMTNCKDEVEITMRSVFLVDTPAEGGTDSVMNHQTIDGLPSFTADGPSFIPAAAEKPVEEASAEAVVEEVAETAADGNAELVVAGEKLFRRCSSCHEVGAGADNKSGPQLNGIMGRAIGGVDGFRYSNVFAEANAEGRVWDDESLAGFIANPKEYFQGTKMSFRGLPNAEDQTALIEYLKSASE
jgi:S-disulfanyl-L-cysteine oxidoreductase SoxD